MNPNNNTTFAISTKYASVGDVLLVVFALVLCVFIVSVNSITILVIRRTQRLHTLSNIYIVSLAVTDAVVGLGLLPLSMFYIPYIRTHYFDKNVNLCVFVLGINLGMAAVSTIHMALIATDRYMYIIWPYLYQKCVHHKIIYLILGCTWTFGIVYALLPQLIHNDASTVSKCDITLVMPVQYLFYCTASIYTVCVIIDIIMYSQILRTANRQRYVIRSTSVSVDSSNTDGSTVDIVPETAHHERSTQSEIKGNRSGHLESNHFAVTIISQDEIIKTVDKNVEIWVKTKPSTQSHVKNSHHEARSSHTSSPGLTNNRNSHMKSVKFFMTVFGVYFICLTPTVVCMGIDYYWPIPRMVYNMFNLLALLNSGMNFFIFYVLNARFRTSVLRLFPCRRVTKGMNDANAPFFDT